MGGTSPHKGMKGSAPNYSHQKPLNFFSNTQFLPQHSDQQCHSYHHHHQTTLEHHHLQDPHLHFPKFLQSLALFSFFSNNPLILHHQPSPSSSYVHQHQIKLVLLTESLTSKALSLHLQFGCGSEYKVVSANSGDEDRVTEGKAGLVIAEIWSNRLKAFSGKQRMWGVSWMK